MYDPQRGYPPVVPCLRYADPPRASAWLTAVLGAREIVRATLPDGWVGHIEMLHGTGVILLARGAGPGSLTQVFVPDAAAARDRAVAAGGSLVEDLADRPWGVRQALVADPEGHQWVLTQHVRDVDPADWYGTVHEPLPG